MARTATCRGTLAKVSSRRLLFRRTALLAVLGPGTGCASTQHTPAALVRSRQLVTVTYPAPQTLRAQAAGRDSLLVGVTMLEGWSTGVRGDTLDVQIGRWRADGRAHEMRPPDFVVAVLPEAGATIRPTGEPGAGSWVIIGLFVVLTAAAMAGLAALGGLGNS